MMRTFLSFIVRGRLYAAAAATGVAVLSVALAVAALIAAEVIRRRGAA